MFPTPAAQAENDPPSHPGQHPAFRGFFSHQTPPEATPGACARPGSTLPTRSLQMSLPSLSPHKQQSQLGGTDGSRPPRGHAGRRVTCPKLGASAAPSKPRGQRLHEDWLPERLTRQEGNSWHDPPPIGRSHSTHLRTDPGAPSLPPSRCSMPTTSQVHPQGALSVLGT